MLVKTKPRTLHRANSNRAKPNLTWRSWCHSRFFIAVRLQRIYNTLPSALHKEITNNTQVQSSLSLWFRHKIRRALMFLVPGNREQKMLLAVRGNNFGFTMTELVLSITLMGILLVSLLAVSVNYLVTITRNNITVDMTVDAQNLLRSTVEELRYGAGVRESNSITDANEPPGGWTTTNTNFVIIIATPAQDSSGNYIINTDTGAPYNNELVYFISGSDLYERTLANTSASGNTELTTCPAASSSSSCPPDVKLIDNIESMQFTLYDQDDIETANPLLARSVKIDLRTSRDSFGSPLVLDNNIRVTLRNDFL